MPAQSNGIDALMYSLFHASLDTFWLHTKLQENLKKKVDQTFHI
jgi:hypothetical protein